MSYPIIVLEGADGSGKTTLANHLAQYHDAYVIHLTYRLKKQMFNYHWWALEQAIKLSERQPVVIDRFWPSINIYDKVFRKHLTFPLAGRMLDRAAMNVGVMYVACLPSNETQFLADFETRKQLGGEMYDSVKEIMDEYYNWLMHQMTGRKDVLWYDRFSHGLDLEAFSLGLISMAKTLDYKLPRWLRNNRQFGGNGYEKDKTLIVGERSNPKGRHAVWPFFAYRDSSLWLTEFLETQGVLEQDLVWANAFNSEGWASPVELERLIKQVQPRQIIALGGKAEKVLWSVGLGSKISRLPFPLPSITKLPHPAYVARFQHGDTTEYAKTFTSLGTRQHSDLNLS